jgi:hypothetical protein
MSPQNASSLEIEPLVPSSGPAKRQVQQSVTVLREQIRKLHQNVVFRTAVVVGGLILTW